MREIAPRVNPAETHERQGIPMSARDSASPGPGSSGGLANGGVGGGWGGGASGGLGGMGGGAGRNGGAGAQFGLRTGTTMYGNTGFGRPGGAVQGYGTQLRNGTMTDLRLANGQRPQQHVSPAAAPPPQGGILDPAPELAVDENVPPFTANPFWNNAVAPANLHHLYRGMINNMMPQKPVGTAPSAWSPAASYNPAIQSIPGYANVHRGFAGSNWQNSSANWPKQSVPGTRSTSSTDGGYPSLGSQDTRPAGVY